MANEQDKRMAAFTIEQMTRKGFFDICAVDKAARLMGCRGNGQAYERLRALHCVDWNDIPADIMQLVPVWINEVLGGPRLSVVDVPALREGNDHLLGTEDVPRIGN